MKVDSYVKRHILYYPALYACFKSYDEAKFYILHHAFIVLGNGIGWAKTEIPEEGGYLTSEYNKGFDAPYGTENIDINIDEYFNENIYQLYKIDFKNTKGRIEELGLIFDDLSFIKNYKACIAIDYNFKIDKYCYIKTEIPKLLENDKILFENEINSFDDILKYDFVLLSIERKELKYDIYPNFSKKYSCFYEKGVEYIQEDWRLEAIEHLKICREKIPTNLSEYHRKEETIKNSLSFIEKTIKRLEYSK